MNTEVDPIQFILYRLCEKHDLVEIIHQLSQLMSTQPKYRELAGQMENIRDAIRDLNE